MWTLVGILVVCALLAGWIQRANARYDEARREQDAAGLDADVLALWDAFGTHEDLGAQNERVSELCDRFEPTKLRSKEAVVALAIMAARSGDVDVLEPLAERATELDGGCGETAALGVLAAAYQGDRPLALERWNRSQAVMAGCASCGSKGDAKILMAEVRLALDALDSGAIPATR